MMPSDMDLFVGTINGYNNLIIIASADNIKSIQLGQNNFVNDEPAIPQETFETPTDDFDHDTPLSVETPLLVDEPADKQQDFSSSSSSSAPSASSLDKPSVDSESLKKELTHD